MATEKYGLYLWCACLASWNVQFLFHGDFNAKKEGSKVQSTLPRLFEFHKLLLNVCKEYKNQVQFVFMLFKLMHLNSMLSLDNN